MTEFASSPCMLSEFGLDDGGPLITAATAAEADEIAAVLVASIETLCAADHNDDPATVAGWTANKTAETVRGWIADPRQDFLVSREAAGGPIACVGAASAEWVLLVYVAPAFRGRGHSSAMLAALEAKMVARGTRTGQLMSSETAHAFYRARGWRDVGRDACQGAGALRGHKMAKDLCP